MFLLVEIAFISDFGNTTLDSYNVYDSGPLASSRISSTFPHSWNRAIHKEFKQLPVVNEIIQRSREQQGDETEWKSNCLTNLATKFPSTGNRLYQKLTYMNNPPKNTWTLENSCNRPCYASAAKWSHTFSLNFQSTETLSLSLSSSCVFIVFRELAVPRIFRILAYMALITELTGER